MKPKDKRDDDQPEMRNSFVLAMTLHCKGDRMRHKGNRRPKDARKKREDYEDE